MRRMLTASALVLASVLFAGCAANTSSEPAVTTLKVGAVTSPMTDVVTAAGTAIDPAYKIELVPVSDYVTINNMLTAGDLDATFSQHIPYMTEYNEKNNADLTAIQPVYNFIIAFYSKKYTDLAQLPDGATVAIPNDSSNAGRALKMLAGAGLITLNPSVDPYSATTADITANPKNLKFLEVEIAQLNTAYDEADLVFQWPSFASKLGLTPQKDGLLTELDDRFILNVDVAGKNKGAAWVPALKAAFTSDAVRDVIQSNPTIELAF